HFIAADFYSIAGTKRDILLHGEGRYERDAEDEYSDAEVRETHAPLRTRERRGVAAHKPTDAIEQRRNAHPAADRRGHDREHRGLLIQRERDRDARHERDRGGPREPPCERAKRRDL